MSGETGWLIELPHSNGGIPRWWCGSSNDGEHPLWSGDANRAVRFSRKVDAEQVMVTTLGSLSYSHNLFVSDHEWMKP